MWGDCLQTLHAYGLHPEACEWRAACLCRPGMYGLRPVSGGGALMGRPGMCFTSNTQAFCLYSKYIYYSIYINKKGHLLCVKHAFHI